ncbi:hypothetical protein EDB92DRAFT_2106234 [Lactarius akahatsu]|uniref:Zinc-finger domain-containing protein n=1 Tax=Lactarius akahatsu TaxID=416441 RepID=A0AAD4LA89_9AGAM|nr:hypothetical protein EDB92DRAFT_2106234 [Lactarius akahatsu]
MCYTLTKASTDEQCPNLFCGLCIEIQYPESTFDRTVEDFECPACCNYCNCSLCSWERGEAYISERDGGWRSWIARQGGSYRTAPIPAKKSKNKDPGAAQVPATTMRRATTMTTTMADAEVFDWELERDGSVHARIVPVSQHTASPAAATTPTPLPRPRHYYRLPDTRTRAETEETAKRRHGGASCPFQISMTTQQKKTVIAGRGRRGKRIQVHRREPGAVVGCSVARWQRRRRRSASLMSPNDDDDGDEDGNLDEGGDVDIDDTDADDGISWPWYPYRLLSFLGLEFLVSP